MHILHVIANPKPEEESNTKQLAAAFLEALKGGNPGATVTACELYAQPPPYYDYTTYRYFWYPLFKRAYAPSAGERAAARYGLEQAARFKAADVLVVTAPMWAFGMPAILKAWFDQALIPGVTFSMGTGGVKGLHHIRKAVLLTSSGGAFEPGDPRDGLRGGIQSILGFVGITDVEVVCAEGQNPFFFRDSALRKRRALDEAAALGRKIAAM
jgi:FMN-dependent NADH-azoreductase